MKKILGLDLGTNSIGWAVVATNNDNKPVSIESLGSRIIPMDAATLSDFDRGNAKSQTAERTRLRSTRRLRERFLLRRERLHRVLRIIDFLPEHYSRQIGWEKDDPRWYGKFINHTEPKIEWCEINRENRIKHEFIFIDSFNEMINDFSDNSPLFIDGKTKVPHDWTIYYLRKKALTRQITKGELAWLLLHFNQKRGYYQLRDENDTLLNQKEYVAKAKVTNIEQGEPDRKNTARIWYTILLENGWQYRATFTSEPKWLEQDKEFLVTEELDDNGNVKTDSEGKEKRKLSILPSFEEIEMMSDNDKNKYYNKIKAKTELTIDESGKTVGEFIYDELLHNPGQKIRGKLIRTIERKYYKEELSRILNKQKEFHAELQNSDLYRKCITELYGKNESQRNNIAGRGFTYLFVEDILFYQRPLKSKKSLINDCPFESVKAASGQVYGVKCIAKSHPLFQEFRLWKLISNLRIYQREKEVEGIYRHEVDVTNEFLKCEDDYVALFDWLNDRKEINQSSLLEGYFRLKKPRGRESLIPYRWNYVEDKIYPCNETRYMILSRLDKSGIDRSFLTRETEERIWHMLYSIEDKYEIEKALEKFANVNGLNNAFVENFAGFPRMKKEYGSYSGKAIKRLLPLIRLGRYWKVEAIDSHTLERIEKIINGEFDENIKLQVREKAYNLSSIECFKGLPEWLASYIVYDRFSEAKEITKWETPEQLDNYIKSFRQHSLRNPLVEQIILESLRTVRDIWEREGQIDEIHIELGRELKNPKDRRRQITLQNIENENTNQRIKAMLLEFKGMSDIENVRPYSPTQQEILKIYEDYALGTLSKDDPEFQFIDKVAGSSQISKSDVMRYKCWLEQKYRSPYTGEVIPLGKLFTPAYEIEHIIPQSIYFDDSFINKVICEAEVNKLKDNQLGLEFIKNHHGEKVRTFSGKVVEIFSVNQYESFVKENYRGERKGERLLLEEIPEKFIQRQINDTRYISREVMRLLSNIVRGKLDSGELEQEAKSKHVIPCTGSVTSILKQEWGLNEVWNRLILPRFERLNEMTGSDRFTSISEQGHLIPVIPFELQKSVSKKRIDHRHHALDALVIACATREHIQYIGNENAGSQKRYLQQGLARKLRRFETIDISKRVKNHEGIWEISTEKIRKEVPREYYKPWETFSEDAYSALREMIVSFRQNLRIINKKVNHFTKYDSELKKTTFVQTKGENWAVRKPMHKDTVFGEVNLRKIKTVSLPEAIMKPLSIVEKDLKKKIIELLRQGSDLNKIKKYFAENAESWKDIDLSKIQVYYFTKDSKDNYYAVRKSLDTSFKREKIENGITDTAIQKIMLRHLEANKNDPEVAFSPEGIEAMNSNISDLNNGVEHKPIYKVRVYEKGDKYSIGTIGNKSKKYVEAAKGTNLFFAVYQSDNGKRTFETIPLNVVIERQKRGLSVAPEENDKGGVLLFVLSPNDLVYVPDEEYVNVELPTILDVDRIYKMVSCSGYQCFFINNTIASPIVDKMEFSALNKTERSISGEMIKEKCIPLVVDRIGNANFNI